MKISLHFVIDEEIVNLNPEEIKGFLKSHYSLLQVQGIKLIEGKDSTKRIEIVSNIKELLSSSLASNDPDSFQESIIKKYKEENTKFREENSKLLLEVQALKSSVNTKKIDNSPLYEQIGILSSRVMELDNLNSVSNEALKKRENEISELKSIIKNLELEEKAKQEKYEKEIMNPGSLSINNMSKENTIKYFKDLIIRLKEENIKMQSESELKYKSINLKLMVSEENYKKIKEENENYVGISKLYNEASDQLYQTKSENEKIRPKFEEAQTKLIELDEKLKKKNASIAQRKQKNNDLIQILKESKLVKEDLQKQLQIEKAETYNLKTELELLLTKIDVKKNSTEIQTDDIIIKSSSSVNTTGTQADLNFEIKELKEKNEKFSSTLQQYKDIIARKDNDILKYKEDMEQIKLEFKEKNIMDIKARHSNLTLVFLSENSEINIVEKSTFSKAIDSIYGKNTKSIQVDLNENIKANIESNDGSNNAIKQYKEMLEKKDKDLDKLLIIIEKQKNKMKKKLTKKTIINVFSTQGIINIEKMNQFDKKQSKLKTFQCNYLSDAGVININKKNSSNFPEKATGKIIEENTIINMKPKYLELEKDLKSTIMSAQILCKQIATLSKEMIETTKKKLNINKELKILSGKIIVTGKAENVIKSLSLIPPGTFPFLEDITLKSDNATIIAQVILELIQQRRSKKEIYKGQLKKFETFISFVEPINDDLELFNTKYEFNI